MRGRTEEIARERAGRRTIAQQRVGFAAQGVDIGTGTAAELQRQEAAITAVDAATIRANAYREALGYQLTASRLEQQRGLTRAAGRQAAAGTLLTGGLRFIRQTRGAYEEYGEARRIEEDARKKAAKKDSTGIRITRIPHGAGALRG
jgi:hypothetical protein